MRERENLVLEGALVVEDRRLAGREGNVRMDEECAGRSDHRWRQARGTRRGAAFRRRGVLRRAFWRGVCDAAFCECARPATVTAKGSHEPWSGLRTSSDKQNSEGPTERRNG